MKTSLFLQDDIKKCPINYSYVFIPVIIVLGYVPLLMRTLSFHTYLQNYDWFLATNDLQIDVFLKVKAIALIIVAVAMLAIMLAWAFQGKTKIFASLKSLPFCFIAGAVFFVILSGLFADNKSLLVSGGFENFESIFVMLSYFVIMVYTFLVFAQSDNIHRDLRFVYRGAAPGFVIIAIIAVFQVFGLDLFKTDFGKSLFASSVYLNGGAEISVGEGAYTTLHNIDYVSVFFAMWVFILLILFTLSNNLKEKIIRGALCVLAVFDLFASGSDGGRIGFLAAVLVMLLMLSLGSKKRVIALIVIVVAAAVLVMAIPFTRNYIIAGIGASDIDTSDYQVHHITPEDDGVHFDFNGEEYIVSYSYDKNETGESILHVVLKDGDGNPLDIEYSPRSDVMPQYYTYSDEDGTTKMIIAQSIYNTEETDEVESQRVVGIMIGDSFSSDFYMFTNKYDDSGDYYFLNPYGKFVREDGNQIPVADIFPDNIFSSRGVIWNHTLPMLKHYIVVGCGSGLFVTAYPQGDYIEKWFGNSNYDVKPHSFYLQLWVEQGLLFLLCVLTFLVMYYIRTIKFYWVNRDEESPSVLATRRIALACMLSVTAYLVSGLVGDSMVVHSPTFWTFLAVGFAAASQRSIPRNVV